MPVSDYLVERLVQTGFDGRLAGLVIAKRTFVIGEDRVLRPADDPDPVRFADEPTEGDDPSASPVRFEADTALVKELTDVVVLGTAHAPGGSPATAFDVGLAVGNWRRTLRVTGPRRARWRPPAKESRRGTVYTPPVFTDPAPIANVPLDFTRAYGGVARYRVPGADDVIEIPCPCNPFGRGYSVQNSPEGLDGLDLPQVEDPATPLTPETIVRDLADATSLPAPGGFAFFGRGWHPRVALLGVMPNEVERARAQARDAAKGLDPAKDAEAIEMLTSFEPPVMKPRYFQGAAPGMAIPYLEGDEPVSLKNLTPSGVLAFNLPGRVPLVRVDRGAGWRIVPTVLDTVVLVVDELRLSLTFRGSLPLEAGEEGVFPSMPIDAKDVSTTEHRQAIALDPRRRTPRS
jgi:hypothetical protein